MTKGVESGARLAGRTIGLTSIVAIVQRNKQAATIGYMKEIPGKYTAYKNIAAHKTFSPQGTRNSTGVTTLKKIGEPA